MPGAVVIEAASVQRILDHMGEPRDVEKINLHAYIRINNTY